MKIICLFVYLLSSILTFAFWRFEGPFLTAIDTKNLEPISVTHTDDITIDEKAFDLISFDKERTAIFLFNYNHDIKYTLIHKAHHNKFSSIQHLQFLYNENKNHDFDFFDIKTDFFLIKNQLQLSSSSYTKESADIITKKWYYTRRANHFTKEKYRTRKSLLIDFQLPQPTKSFFLDSGLKIKNKKNNVTIISHNKKINLQQFLIRYFNNDEKYAIIINAVSQIKFDDNTEKKQSVNSFDIGQAMYEIQNNQPLNLLENSTILAVYAVFKDDNNRDSIIWGLANEHKTNKQFHWITKLKNDISTLFYEK